MTTARNKEMFNKTFVNLRIILFVTLTIFLAKISIYLTYQIFFLTKGFLISFTDFLSKINRTDSFAYATIIKDGYSLFHYTGSPYIFNINFFPLFPIILKAFYSIFSFNISTNEISNIYFSAFLLNTILLFFVCIFAYKYLMLTRKDRWFALMAIFLLTNGPWSFYSLETMPETLFMLLLILGLYFLEKKCYLRAGLCGMLLSATKLYGVFFILIILIKTIQDYIKNTNRPSFIDFIKYLLKTPSLILAISLVPIGLISYMLFLQIKFNDGLGFIHTQQYGFGIVYNSYFNVLFTANVAQVIVLILSLMVCAYLIIEKRFHEAILPILCYLLIGYATLLSLPRYFFSSFAITFGCLDLLFTLFSKNKKYEIAGYLSFVVGSLILELVLDLNLLCANSIITN